MTAHTLAATPETIHWGYFSQRIEPCLHVESGDTVTIEGVTHHSNDDHDRMVKGDPNLEAIFSWTKEGGKRCDRRGAGSTDPKIYTKGCGDGLGCHILTGPIAVKGAEPGDVLEIQILDILPRKSKSPEYEDKHFGVCAAANWGFHYSDYIEEPKPREVVTVYEMSQEGDEHFAKAAYSFRWTPQTDPDGIVHPTIDYPGVKVDHSTLEKKTTFLDGVKIPVRPHFGCIGLAPNENDYVDTVPPGYFGGNIDNWRCGKGANLFLPVSVAGGLLSIGDPHACQGDSELAGTAIESSLTGTVKVILHKKADLPGTILEELYYPLLETKTEYVVHGFSYPNHLEKFGENVTNEMYAHQPTIDDAMRDAFRKMRHLLMKTQGLTEDESITLMSVGCDFGLTQVVDRNVGCHGIVRKELLRKTK